MNAAQQNTAKAPMNLGYASLLASDIPKEKGNVDTNQPTLSCYCNCGCACVVTGSKTSDPS